MSEVRIIGLDGIPEVHPGDDIAALILEAAAMQDLTLESGDIVVITQKIISKAEGRIVDLDDIEPGHFATEYAEQWEKDARLVETVLRESARIVRMDHGVMICETKHGLICANAGVDSSNVEKLGTVTLLPEDPDGSAHEVRQKIEEETGASPAVIITDTFGRPWREGHVNFAIGVAGMVPIVDYAGQFDPAGYEIKVTQMAVADELAAASELMHGKLSRMPVAVIRGYEYPAGSGTADELLRDPERDMFR